jgi:hypothetical protein
MDAAAAVRSPTRRCPPAASPRLSRPQRPPGSRALIACRMPASKPVARLLLCSLAALCATAAEATQSYVLDPSNVRHRFDGVGGLSAGASSRLLFDYPEPYRSDILDFLYLPNFGANLWINKVEIGSDTDSTNGAESSHMHTSGDLNFQRGYDLSTTLFQPLCHHDHHHRNLHLPHPPTRNYHRGAHASAR